MSLPWPQTDMVRDRQYARARSHAPPGGHRQFVVLYEGRIRVDGNVVELQSSRGAYLQEVPCMTLPLGNAAAGYLRAGDLTFRGTRVH
jgi:hypothetical protein